MHYAHLRQSRAAKVPKRVAGVRTWAQTDIVKAIRNSRSNRGGGKGYSHKREVVLYMDSAGTQGENSAFMSFTKAHYYQHQHK